MQLIKMFLVLAVACSSSIYAVSDRLNTLGRAGGIVATSGGGALTAYSLTQVGFDSRYPGFQALSSAVATLGSFNKNNKIMQFCGIVGGVASTALSGLMVNEVVGHVTSGGDTLSAVIREPESLPSVCAFVGSLLVTIRNIKAYRESNDSNPKSTITEKPA